MHQHERGFTLIEVSVVVGLLAIILGSAGHFFLGNTTPAVATAATDILAAIDETRQTAQAFDSATLVFAGASGGFTVRVYERTPGDDGFRARNGLEHAGNVTLAETAAPLGSPGFALAMDSHGRITGYTHFSPTDTSFDRAPCPAAGTFTLALRSSGAQRAVSIPCTPALTSVAAATVAAGAPAASPTPHPAGTCPALSPCTPAPLGGVVTQCPSGYSRDAGSGGTCSACPNGYIGVPPTCSYVGALPTQTPTIAHYTVAIEGCGSVVTVQPSSVSGLQYDTDGSAYVTYLDVNGVPQAQYCAGRSNPPPVP